MKAGSIVQIMMLIVMLGLEILGLHGSIYELTHFLPPNLCHYEVTASLEAGMEFYSYAEG